MISEDYGNLPIAVYEAGSFFGDIEVFKNLKRYFSCIALVSLELLTIDKANFKRIFFRQYPILGQMFLVHIEKRWNNIEEILFLIDGFLNPNKNKLSGNRLIDSIKKEGIFLSKISRNSSVNNKSIVFLFVCC